MILLSIKETKLNLPLEVILQSSLKTSKHSIVVFIICILVIQKEMTKGEVFRKSGTGHTYPISGDTKV